MTEEKQPRYELRPRSENYVGLYEGKHCLCAICTNTARGVLDAQLLLRVCNSNADLLTACEALYNLADNGSASFDDPEPDSPYLKAKAAIAKAEPSKPGSEAANE